MASCRTGVVLVAALAAMVTACSAGNATTHIALAGESRYVVLLDGLGSTGPSVPADFTEITTRLQRRPNVRRLVLFSYGATAGAAAVDPCAGWSGCDWHGLPSYEAGQVTGPPPSMSRSRPWTG